MDGFMKSYDCQDDGTKRLDFMMHVTPSLSGALNYLAPLHEAAQSWLFSSAYIGVGPEDKTKSRMKVMMNL